MSRGPSQTREDVTGKVTEDVVRVTRGSGETGGGKGTLLPGHTEMSEDRGAMTLGRSSGEMIVCSCHHPCSPVGGSARVREAPHRTVGELVVGDVRAD